MMFLYIFVSHHWHLYNGDISVDVKILHNKLEGYFKKYVNDLKDINQIKLRENFIITMNYLCLCN